MLAVRNIHVNYGASQVLHGVSLEVQQGEVVAVMGRNGVGKSTLLRAIMGLTPARLGDIEFKGSPIAQMPAHKIARLGIGYVPQGRRVFPSLNVREHLTVTARGSGRDAWTTARVCEMFPNLTERLGQSGAKLSGGEQEMLAMGRALVSNPECSSWMSRPKAWRPSWCAKSSGSSARSRAAARRCC
jgi:branched-chain amino acid transport system ATP-binding protein